MHMLSLLRHPASQDYIPQITTLLTDLGATNSEVSYVSFSYHLGSLLGYVASQDYITQIATLLPELGATNSEQVIKHKISCLR